MSAEFTIKIRIRADQASLQTFFTVAVLVLFTIKYRLTLWMKAAVVFVDHGASSLLNKFFGVKLTAHSVLGSQKYVSTIERDVSGPPVLY